MKILELIKNINFVGVKNLNDFEVESISCDTNEENLNGIYFCLIGYW